MTDHDIPSAGPTAPATGAPPRRCGRGRRGLLPVLGLLVIGGAIGAFAGKAFSHGPLGHFHHGPGLIQIAAPGAPIDPARVDEMATRMSKHLGVEVDATAEQQAKLTAISRAAVQDLLPLREKMQAGRKQLVDLLTAPTVDRAAVEQLRTQQMSTIDEIGKRLSAAVADGADVLTPDQRKRLAERIQQAREHRGWAPWHRG